jgi:hypothetical protein
MTKHRFTREEIIHEQREVDVLISQGQTLHG